MKAPLFTRRLLVAMAILGGLAGMMPAQLVRVPLEKRISLATLVVEGEVTHSHSFVGGNGRIYSSHQLRIDKVMKGSPGAATLEIISEGGTVGDKSLWISHHLFLKPKAIGVFFLNPIGPSHPALLSQQKPAYEVYADLQGFIQFKRQSQATVASEPFRIYQDIERDLYPLLGWKSGQAPVLHHSSLGHSTGGIVIDSIRPLEITAGTRSVLSIHGTGFLDSRGTVHFPDADAGGLTTMEGDSTDFQLWTDTLIRIWVPSSGILPGLEGTAGTGRIEVQNANGDTGISPDTLQVRYAVKNSRNEVPGPAFGVSRFNGLFDQDVYAATDTSGGYTFRFSDSFSATDSAEATFRKALREWRCATGVNFKVGPDTSLSIDSTDLVNLVHWDNLADSLPAGVLGKTNTTIAACNGGQERAYIIYDVDFTFSKNQPWNFDTIAVDPLKYDFFSNVLHEIGHAHSLDHVINDAEVMHYDLSIGETRRVIAGSTLRGGRWVMDSSVVARGSCPGPMMAVDSVNCNLLPLSPSLDALSRITVYPNPAFDMIHLQVSGSLGSQTIKLSLLEAHGNRVAPSQFEPTRVSSSEWSIRLGDLPSGLYFAMIQYGNAVVTQKIVLIR